MRPEKSGTMQSELLSETDEAEAMQFLPMPLPPAAPEPARAARSAPDFSRFIGSSSAMQEVYGTITRLLDTGSTVLILGESGTGKELVAKAIHDNSDRAGKPLITVNCGAIPEELLESELFGHEKGAFTGAIRTRIGKFELAHGGTIFLDEIGDMSPTLQVKLLRILQEQEFERVGGARTVKVDVRVVAATNQDLEKAIEERRFREDLYYRLNVIPIELPPLRDRGNDVEQLVDHFIERFNTRNNRRISGLTSDAMGRFKSYRWPGNVRELEHMMERLVILKGEGQICSADLPPKLRDLDPVADEQLLLDMLLVGDPDELASEGVAGMVNPDGTPTPATPAPPVAAQAGFAPLGLVDPREVIPDLPEDGLSLKDVVDRFETQLILAALERTGGVKNKAATLLGLNRTTLVEKLKKKKLLEK